VIVLMFGVGGQLSRALAATAPDGIKLVALGREQCELGEPRRIIASIERYRPGLVINAAAYTAVDKAESDAEAARAINSEAPGVIAAAARAVGARTVHVSTDFVFSGRDSSPRRPDDATDPLGVYGATKLDGERAVMSADGDALIVRTAWVYAAEGANFVNTMLRLMAERRQLSVVADQIGTPTWATSLAAAIWTLSSQRATGIYHFTDAGVASWYDFAVAIAEEALALGMIPEPVAVNPITSAEYPTPARRPAYAVLDKSKTWAALGGAAPHWRENLRRCLKEKSANG
jgi:dTDP-4-dehydrorhamnose reductase